MGYGCPLRHRSFRRAPPLPRDGARHLLRALKFHAYLSLCLRIAFSLNARLSKIS